VATAAETGEVVYPWVPEEARQDWVRRNRSALDQLRAALSHAPLAPEEWPDESLHARFLDAVFALAEGASAPADVAALGAAVLRRHDALGLSKASFRVPSHVPWPTVDHWRQSGVLVHLEPDQTFRVWAQHWRPSWLGAGGDLPFVDVDAAFERRLSSDSRRADPFFSALTGHPSYSSDGQRLAVRAVVASAKDSTTLVVLPTGGGKTAVAHVAALLGDRRGTTVVVVPTVALALDQERAFRDLLSRTGRHLISDAFTYHSGLTEGERLAFRQRIREGEQRIIFAAPESVERSLAYSLYEAAEYGLITAFVIDEAHVVAEWGDEFRPEFQSVGGLRRGLLRLAERSQSGPFRTLLLTATPTQEAVETLRVAFSDQTRPLEVVGAPELRIEPTYWAHEFTDEAARVAAVLEAVQHLPRPMLLYTTKRDDATRWEELLRASGFKRVARVDGDTAADRRRDVLDGWRGLPAPGRASRATRYDVVVATSAFGLGVDQEDVRSVIHVCIPETVDRFYQEVGRGGRDGRASLSLVLHCPQDVRIAKHINRTKLITPELAKSRLRAMLANAEALGDNRWRVDLAALPPQTPHKRSYNLQWNQRTVNLLARAGGVAWDGERPELSDSATEDETDPEAWGAVIRLLRSDHRSTEFWEDVQAVRARRLRTDTASLDRMLEALAVNAQVHRILRDSYEVNVDSASLEPAESCGGCPWCRERDYPWLVGGAVPISTVKSAVAATGPLARLVGRRQAGILVYREGDSEWRQKVSDALRKAVSMGGISVVLDPSIGDLDLGRLEKVSPFAAAFIETPEAIDLRDLRDIPTVFVIGPQGRTAVSRDLVDGGYLYPQSRLLIVSDATRDPSRADRLVRDIRPTEPIESFLGAT
jgi:ATP-dependent DNA helicase RecQ